MTVEVNIYLLATMGLLIGFVGGVLANFALYWFANVIIHQRDDREPPAARPARERGKTRPPQ